MSLRSAFLAFKKVVQVVQIGGERGEVILKKSKRTATFFRDPFPKRGNQASDLISSALHQPLQSTCNLHFKCVCRYLAAKRIPYKCGLQLI